MSYLYDFRELFYPRNCGGCGTALHRLEQAICLGCVENLPRAHMSEEADNCIEKLFWNRAKIVAASAYMRMGKSGTVHSMIHELKYSGKQDIGLKLGKLFAREISKSQRIPPQDLILPVPLHPKRMKTRGYNQCMSIAKGMQEILKIPIAESALIRTKYNDSQTSKGRYGRWDNVSDIFELRDAEGLGGKRVLLVDDVITTGSTIEACSIALHQAEGIELTVVALAHPVH